MRQGFGELTQAVRRAHDQTPQPIVTIPYTQDCNNVAMMLLQRHVAAEYRNRAIDQFGKISRDSLHWAGRGAPSRLGEWPQSIAPLKMGSKDR
jgi:hypothetical protein